MGPAACTADDGGIGPNTLSSLAITPGDLRLEEYDTARLVATAYDAEGRAVPTGTLLWSSTDTLVVEVDSTGRLTARGAGSAEVTVTAGPLRAAGRATVIPLRFTLIAVGDHHACGLTAGGRVYCWGSNIGGALGAGPAPETCGQPYLPCSTAPVPVATASAFDWIGAGTEYSCGRTTGGQVYCWGEGARGALAGGSTEPSATPRLAAATPFRVVASGGLHSCGIESGGSTACWGANFAGELGVGSTAERCLGLSADGGAHPCSTRPLHLDDDPGFVALAVGGHSCGLSPRGEARCWGSNSAGQLGGSPDSGTCGEGDPPCSARPVPVAGELVFRSLSVGDRHTCGLTSSGAAYCWGSNLRGQLGTQASETCPLGQLTEPCARTPQPVSGGVRFASIFAGPAATCALTDAGRAYCWGANSDGQLGDGTTEDRATPSPVAGNLLFAHLSVGAHTTCGVGLAGDAYCWGRGRWGELGNGSREDRLSPVPVSKPRRS